MDPNIQTPQSPAQQPVQTPPPADPIQDHGLRFTKYLWIFLAILVLITAIGSTAYFLNRNQAKQIAQTSPSPTPTPDPTADWKTYENAKFGYSFKYPASFEAFDSKRNDQTTIFVAPFSVAQAFKNSQVFEGKVGIAIIKNNNFETPVTNSYSNIDQKNVTVDGISAIKYSTTYTQDVPQIPKGSVTIDIVVERNGDKFILSYEKADETTFNQILSTFKFTGQSDPKAVTESFYNWYLACINNHFSQAAKDPTYNKSPLEACPYYLNDNLISPAKDLRAHGADPILCAQSTPTNLAVDNPTITGNSAQTTVHTFYSESGDNPIKVDLELINNSWKINSITCKY